MPEPFTSEDFELQIAKAAETELRREDVEEILAAFAKRRGLPEMRFDEHGEITLTLGDTLDVALSHIPGFPGVMAGVVLPEEFGARADIGLEMLQANLSWQQSGGGTFGRVAETGRLTYCQLLPLHERDDEAFERRLLAFADHAEEWLTRLEAALDDDPSDGQVGQAPPTDMWRV